MTHHPIHHHHKRSRVGRLPRWQKNSTYLLFLVCALSGLGFFLAHEWFISLPLISTRALLIAHGVSAYGCLLAFGAVMPGHIRAAWNTRRNRVTGTAMTLVLSLLILTGLGLYYGTEDMHETVLWVHWIVGFVILLVFPLHLIIGRRQTHHAH